VGGQGSRLFSVTFDAGGKVVRSAVIDDPRDAAGVAR
jgi:hypothetical protein